MNHLEVAKAFIASEFFPVIEIHSDGMFIYSQDTRIWKQIDKKDLKESILNELDEYAEASTDPQLIRKMYTKSFQMNVVSCSMEMVPRSNVPFNTLINRIPLAGNQVLDLALRQVSERTREHRFTYFLPVKWNPEADPTVITKFLGEILTDEGAAAFRKITYSCLFNSLPSFRVYFWGKGNNGKTTLTNLLMKIMGPLISTGKSDLSRVIVVRDQQKPSEVTNIFEIHEENAEQAPWAGIEFETVFNRDPKGDELKADPHILETIFTEENKSAFLNWILS